ncbi:hypothetical protein [Janibacter sp. GXQ6167]|uniref:hypothetical protein n=1 Tax=Janibacter sp. GXQ6167 TaxID=3240791 RepID=UPI0035256CDA
MSERWSWTYTGPSGQPLSEESAVAAGLPIDAVFPTQADAEAWFAEIWGDLADAGVSAVTLHRDGDVVYGPMSLEATE